MKFLTLLLILFCLNTNAKSKAPACAFSRIEKGEIVELKKPEISRHTTEIKLTDGATAVIKKGKSGVELSIGFREVTTKMTTKDPSMTVLTIKSGLAEYELQCAL